MAIRGLTGWLGVVLGSPDPQRLAQFYSDLLGWEYTVADPTWVTMLIRSPSGEPTHSNLAFQLEPDHVPPVWPGTPTAQQMQVHLDIGVQDAAAAAVEAVALGATLAPYQPQPEVRVMLDPDGHPFCLYTDQE